jgi:hypothetical protein
MHAAQPLQYNATLIFRHIGKHILAQFKHCLMALSILFAAAPALLALIIK